MPASKRPVNAHDAYHAHVYYDQHTVEQAAQFCKEAGERFNLKVGRMHQALVGPHPKWSCQITFFADDFDVLVPWLDENRPGLTILIHALTGDDLKDHTEHASFLGDRVALNLSMFGGE